MAKKKINYDEYDCYIDPQKIVWIRTQKDLAIEWIVKETGCFNKYDILSLEKGTEKKRMNFGVAKKLASVLGEHYTKFVILAPNQMTLQTRYCIKTMKKLQQAEVVAEVIPTEINPAPAVSFDAVPVAVIFKDKTGREFKYVLDSSEVA